MPEVSGIYDSAVIQPVCKFMENISIFTSGLWNHYQVQYIEPMPRSPASTVDMIAQAGATILAANATLAKRVVTILQVNDFELLHLRWRPLENVEGLIWEQSGTAKFNSRNIHCRVDRFSVEDDPHLAQTTFFVLGINRDMNLEVRNPMQVAIPIARFVFWGFRYVLKDWTSLKTFTTVEKNLLLQGDLDSVKRLIGTTTWLPAEGRTS